MEINDAILAFSTLGHPGRLAVFRLLMRFAPQGVRPTEIATALKLRPNTLSHHLSELSVAGLIRGERQGRSLFYAVELRATEALIRYLARDIGRMRPDLVGEFAELSVEQPSPRIDHRPLNVLFLCTSNSARSILAEALLNDLGKGRFRAYSAGTHPRSAPNPLALEVLARSGHETTTLRSKSLSEFQSTDAPEMDFIFTVCDRAAGEDCPPWPGRPITGHWGIPDPTDSGASAAERAAKFAEAYAQMRKRVEAFTQLPLDRLTRLSQQRHVDAIGLSSQHLSQDRA
ncbi:helix-turn-helix domain-containing protein [Thioclava sp. FR2]|uniref:arsenate reductase/protein-tyrosine-phosphatase family protein n=1 Tax=Thioclava sp. FR2 TaxID=3445780 RepID=UPI003EB93EC5